MEYKIIFKPLKEKEKKDYKNQLISLSKIIDENSENFINDWINDSNFLIFVLMNDNNVIGMTAVQDCGLSLNLYGFCIEKQFQDNKLGSWFLLEVEKFLKSLTLNMKIENIIIMLSATEATKHFFEKNNYSFLYNLKRFNKNLASPLLKEAVMYKNI